MQARSEELEQVQQELAKLTATEGKTASALVTAQNELTSITDEVKNLRDEVQAAQKDADGKFARWSQLTDEVNQMRRVKTDLENRQKPLQEQVAALRDAMDKVGVRVDVGRRRNGSHRR